MIKDESAAQAGYRFIGAVIGTFIFGWVPMLGLGVLHTRFTVVPALGYWETVVVVLTVGAILGRIRVSS